MIFKATQRHRRWCYSIGHTPYRHMCRSFLNLTVKMALKYVVFDEVTDKNKLAPFHGLYCVYHLLFVVCSNKHRF